MITVAVEPFSVVEDNKHLTELSWDEVGFGDDDHKLDVNWELYRHMEDNNGLVTVVARNDREVVGYSIFIVVNRPHAKGAIVVENDALYLKKECRGFGGKRLIKECHRILGELYPKALVLWHVTKHKDFSSLLTHLGCEKLETVYGLKVG